MKSSKPPLKRTGPRKKYDFFSAVMAMRRRTAPGEPDSLNPKTEEQLAGEITTLMAAVQRENRFVKLLQEIAVAANEAANVEEAIRRSIERICEVTGWPMGHLYLTSEGGDRLISKLFLDLDGFKPINDTLGHAAGDWLLQETAARLVQSVRSSDLVARLGGDEFLVLLTTLSNARDAEIVTQKLLARIGTPLAYEGQMLRISASVGIGIYPDDAFDADRLIAVADEAMYTAKKAGGQGYRFFASHGAGLPS
jgi:diguanylate cyclase (GGDEF)-like protein